MAKFKYSAIDKLGKEIKGLEEAESMQAVIAGIRERGFFPVKIIPVGKTGSIQIFLGGGIKVKVVTMSTRQLATLLNAGLPLVRALKVVEEQQPSGQWKKTLRGLIESVEGGSSFSDALGRYPRIFTKLYVNMVKAGESAGLLDVILARLADFYEKNQRLRSKVLAALIYPCLVLGVAFLILTGLMIFVVPKFADMFRDMGVELPFLTGLLIKISSSMLTFKFWAVIILVAMVVKLLISTVKKYDKGRYIIDKIRLKFPVFGKLLQKLVVSRFARTLGTLVASGVPILNALNIVKETVDNEVVSKGLAVVHDSVREGESIVAPLRHAAVFDPVVINMAAIGEETGKLDEMLLKIADTYDNEADIMIAGITSLLEPFLIITLAVVIGFIVISLFLPLVKLLTTLATTT